MEGGTISGQVSVSVVERGAGLAVVRCFGVAILAVVAVALVAPRNTWFVFDRSVVLIVGGAALVVGWMAIRRGGVPGGAWARRRPGTAVVAGTLVATALAGVHAAASLIRFGWDASVVVRAAGVLQDGGRLDPALLDYFARFPNNVALLFLESVTARVGALVGLPVVASLIVAQVVLFAVVPACLGRTAQVLGHPERVFPVQGAALVLLGLSPHLAVPYSDVPAAACVAVAVLAMASHRATLVPRRRVAWGLLAVVALALGMALKPFVAVVPVAVLLVTGMVVLGSRSWHVAGRAGAGVVVAGLGLALTMVGIGQAAQHGTGLTQQRLEAVRAPFPVELWLASGTYDSQDPSPTRRYGAYRQELYDLTASLTDPREQREVLRQRVEVQVDSRGVTGNLAFFSAKVAWVWGDGTFWAHGEGTASQQASPHTTGPLSTLSEWAIAQGDHYRLRAAAVQGLWLALLLSLGLASLRAAYDRLLATWCLALIGLSGYLMLFEARPRYLFALLPVLLALVAAIETPRQQAVPSR